MQPGAIPLPPGLDTFEHLEEHELLLRPKRAQPSKLQRMKLPLIGAPWDMSAKPTEREGA